MARKKPSANTGFVLFDVFYEDGSRSSNRKVPAADLGGLDGDEPARTFLEEQESRIAEASGKPRAKIASIVRSGKATAKAEKAPEKAAGGRRSRA